MRFGIIGAGNIGSTLSRKLVHNGHEVKIADARGIDRLEGKELVGEIVTIEEVIKNIDILITSIPLPALSDIRSIIQQVEEHVIVVDTSNYAPTIRDQRIEEIENGMVESVWVSNQLGRPVIKAFNNLLTETLDKEGKPEGTSYRIAMAIAGDNQEQKQTIEKMVSELGFDTVDSGNLSDSWRHQPGTPAYCTELTKEELVLALDQADKQVAIQLREQFIERITELFAKGNVEKQVIVNLKREIYKPILLPKEGLEEKTETHPVQQLLQSIIQSKSTKGEGTTLLSDEYMKNTLKNYLKYFNEQNADAVIDLLANEIIGEDPVGTNPIVGKENLESFIREGIVNVKKVDLLAPIRTSFANSAAMMINTHILVEGKEVVIETIDVAQFDSSGKITRLQAYWGADNVSLVK